MSEFPWTIKFCNGPSLQFLILSSDSNIVMMGEMYNEKDLLSILTFFQRNPEIKVDESSYRNLLRVRKDALND